MITFSRLVGSSVCMLALLAVNVQHATAADDDPTFILRPHCEEGYRGSDWIFGGIAPPGWNTAENPGLCPSFEIEDPQTLRTPILKVGETLDFDLVVQNPGGKPISSIRAWLNYDSSVLEGVEITVDEKSFTELTPGETDFSAQEGYIKIQASIPGKNASTRYFVPVARIKLKALQDVSPGSILNFYDIQRDGHTYILSKGETGKERYVLGQEPGSVLVRITKAVQGGGNEGGGEPAGGTENPGEPAEGGAEGSEPSGEAGGTPKIPAGQWCTGNEECESGVCTAGICEESTEPVVQEPAGETCTDDVECPIGKDCIEGMCKEPQGIIPSGGACVLSAQCSTGLCVEGMCKDPETHKNDRTAFSLLQIRNVRVTSEGSSAFLQWDDLRSSSLKTYNVYYGTTSGEYIQRKIIPGGAPSVTIRNLPEGTTYYFAVRAANTSDEESAFSQEVAVEIGNPATSTAPLVASLFTDAPGQNPIGDTAMEVPGETGMSSVLVTLIVFSAVIGTLIASRRQIIAHP